MVLKVTYEILKDMKVTVGKGYDALVEKYQLNEIKKLKQPYVNYCISLLMIKTLARPDEDVFIDEIYSPVIVQGVNTLSIEISNNTNLEYEEKAILIKGLAGMGKSTLLKKLLANNIQTGDRVPVF